MKNLSALRIHFIVFLIFPVISNAFEAYEVECIDDPQATFLTEDINAYNFGLKIQEAFRARDLDKIIQLIGNNELIRGPRKSQLLRANFDQVFTDEAVTSITKDPPMCSQLGSNGWMLGPGSVWYKLPSKNRNTSEVGDFYIFSINAAEDIEEINLLKSGWYFEGNLLHPKLFFTESLSGDKFEEIAAIAGLTNLNDFSSNPGRYLESHISIGETILGKNGAELDFIPNVNKFSDLPVSNGDFSNDENICVKISEDSKGEICYSLISRVPQKLCQNLAPNVNEACIQSYLVKAGYWGGGSMGFYYQTGIYGLFSKEGCYYLAPLKMFEKTNDALNYLDKL